MKYDQKVLKDREHLPFYSKHKDITQSFYNFWTNMQMYNLFALGFRNVS